MKEQSIAMNAAWEALRKELLELLAQAPGYEDHPRAGGFLFRSFGPHKGRDRDRGMISDKIIGVRPVFGYKNSQECSLHRWNVAVITYDGFHPPGRKTDKFLLRPSLPHHTRSYPWLHDIGVFIHAKHFDLSAPDADKFIKEYVIEQATALKLIKRSF